jgi:flavin-dependent dehydrogenase
MTEFVDLIIIGAGPAGLSTALHLLQAQAGWGSRMLVFEKAIHPRPKLCGGGVTRLGLQILKDLEFDLPLPLPQARVDEVRLVYRDRTIHVRGSPEFVVFNRLELDAYLAEEARRRGAILRENEPITSLEPDASGVTVKTGRGSYRARAVVGADGSKGLTRQVLQAQAAPNRVARLLEVVSPAPPNASQFAEQFARFDFTHLAAGLQGYFWDFPSRVGAQTCFNRGVYDARFVPARPRARLSQLLTGALQSLDGEFPPEKVSGHPIHWFSPRGRFAAPRLLLVGDAAGADPLFGEGIAPALGYGRVAARAVQQAFRSEDFSFHNYRRELFFSPVGRYLLLRWCVAWWSYRLGNRPWFIHALWTVGQALASLFPQDRALYE